MGWYRGKYRMNIGGEGSTHQISENLREKIQIKFEIFESKKWQEKNTRRLDTPTAPAPPASHRARAAAGVGPRPSPDPGREGRGGGRGGGIACPIPSNPRHTPRGMMVPTTSRPRNPGDPPTPTPTRHSLPGLSSRSRSFCRPGQAPGSNRRVGGDEGMGG